MRKIRFFGVCFLAGIFLVACGVKEISLGAEDAGKKIELTVGEKMLVTLDSNPTTGFVWEIAEIDEAVLLQQGEAKYSSEETSLVGSGGVEAFTFEAVGAGKTALQLIYHRPWEEDVEPVEVFSVTVVVTE
ncbi:MAG: hypothetical protein B6243_03410 [Anaerolineaceae bacterium 4572_5.2]|nr:MAG: hypothetical protein B6243_03410 [Anaerolineaceae bacterium 4572_5.2]